MVEKCLKSLIKRIFFTILCAVTVVFSTGLPYAYENKSWAQEENIPNEYIFQVLLLPDWRISEAIFAYEKDGKYYLPLRELSENFEFYADVEVQDRFAQGYASREENTFTLDGSRNEITVRGERRSIAEDAILSSEYLATDDLYVQYEIINELWPVNMTIDLSNLTISVEAEEELSFIRDKKREDQRDQMMSRKELREESKKLLPRRENTYQMLGRPVLDYQAVYQFDTEEDDLVGSNIFTGVQHLGKALADYSANFRLEDGNIVRPDNIRFKLSRQSAGEEYLLPGLRKAEAGDVTIGQRDLITNTAIGRGITLSNDNKNRNSEFDLITIVGSGPPGWDIEIYNNEELVNFGVVPNDGQYVFEDVVLNYGNNEVKILFFGPQGQVREELRTYNAGGNMLPEGQFRYNAGILDSDRPFILLDNSPRTEPRGTVKTLNTSYGVNRWLTLLGNYTEIPNADKSREYATLGAAASTPIGLFEGEAYREVAGGHAFNLSYITKFLGFRANLNAAVYKDFESELSGFGTNRKTFETKAQLNRNIKLFTLPLGLRFNTIHTERKSGLKTTDVDFTQTFSRGGIRLSHNTSTRLADNAHERTTGGLTTTVREGPWQLRGGINYNMYPETELASGNAEIRYKTEDGFQAALNLSHNFTTSDYRIGTQAGYDFKTFLGTAEAAYIRDGGFEFILRATTSLHPYTNDDGYEFSSASRRQYAPVRARVFLDENADGEFNEGEQPIEGAQLRIGGGKTREGTDKDGYIIANAPGDTITNVYVDTPSLKDPYYIPAYEGFSTVPIQGKMIDAVFPVVETGSIEGTVYRQSNRKAVAGLILNLVDIASNEKIMSVETGFDGFYVFEFVKPGTYRVETDETHLVDLVENSASVAPGDLYVYGHDIYINDEDFIGGENMDIQESAAEPMGPELPADLEPAAGESAENQNTAPEQENTEPSNNFDVSLHDPRFKSHKDKLRFMINASEPVDYEILPASTQSSIDILIKQALISQQQDLRIEKDGREYDCKFSQTPDGVKISISADEPLGIQYSSLLPATTAEDNRLLIDLKPMLAQ